MLKIITSILLITISFCDTLTIHPITFKTLSPNGWNAQYNTIVPFPNSNKQWSKILMVQTLKCDSLTEGDKFACGEWDYIWSTFVNVPNGDTTEQFCLGSFVTPYGKRLELNGEKGWQWVYDVSEYAPILYGDLNLAVGNNQELLDLKFHFIEGTPPRDVISIENIYPHDNYNYGFLADDSLLKEKEIILNSKAEGFQIKSIISGHGHEGPRNCCEWDSKTHTWFIDGWQLFRWNVWTDCGNNPIYPQGGTWPFDRAGWCPGAIVDEKLFELTPFVTPGDTISLDYRIQNYDDEGEKEGTFRMTHQLISYGPPNFLLDAEIVDIISPSSQDKYSRINPNCGNPKIIIQNSGKFNLKMIDIIYGFDGKRKSYYSWIGNLGFLERDTLELSSVSLNYFEKNTQFSVELRSPNGMGDENLRNNKLESIAEKPIVFPTIFQLKINTNNINRARENSFTISNIDGKIFYSSDKFKDDTEYNYDIDLEKGCYQFLFKDLMEDGISVHWWYRNSNPNLVGINGIVKFVSMNGEELYSFNPDFGQELRLNFVVE